MHLGPASGIAALAAVGVARVSHGSMPYKAGQAALRDRVRAALL